MWSIRFSSRMTGDLQTWINSYPCCSKDMLTLEELFYSFFIADIRSLRSKICGKERIGNFRPIEKGQPFSVIQWSMARWCRGSALCVLMSPIPTTWSTTARRRCKRSWLNNGSLNSGNVFKVWVVWKHVFRPVVNWELYNCFCLPCPEHPWSFV